jgi:AraC family transcriptional regulator, regulatory protein of adaptative response / methylated-DNA-[protein]-cysteine methyltransferase
MSSQIKIEVSEHASAFGMLTISTTPQGVRALALHDEALRSPHHATSVEHNALCLRVLSQLELDRDAHDAAHAIPLDLCGTAFQLRVWRALQQIPWGATLTYAQLATAIHAPRSARAVGSACGANTIAVLIPCHRVLRGDGGLGGYRWGLARKRALLLREQAPATRAVGLF